MLINNKEKQFARNNWGSDKWTKEHTEIKLDIKENETIPYRKSKKKKRIIKPYSGHCCPFCNKELPFKPEDKLKNQSKFRVLRERVDICECGCYKVSECPACKHETFYNPRTRIYKHQSSGCGFEGKNRV